MVVGGLQAGDDYHLTGERAGHDADAVDAALRHRCTADGPGSLPRPLPAPVADLEPVADAAGVLARPLPAHQRSLQRRRQAARTDLPAGTEPRSGSGPASSVRATSSATTSSTPRSWPSPPTVSAYRRAWWWEPCPTARAGCEGRDVQAWIEVRVADGSWRTMPNQLFMSHRAPKGIEAKQSASRFVKDTTPEAKPPNPPPSLPQSTSPLPPAVQHPGQYWPIWLAALARRAAGGPAAAQAGTPAAPSPGEPGHRALRGWVGRGARPRARPGPGGAGHVCRGPSRLDDWGSRMELARSADRQVFAREEPTADDAAAFWAGVNEERRRLGREAGHAAAGRWRSGRRGRCGSPSGKCAGDGVEEVLEVGGGVP